VLLWREEQETPQRIINRDGAAFQLGYTEGAQETARAKWIE
jgi:hypothetical protein